MSSPTAVNPQITDSVAPDLDDQNTSVEEQSGPTGSREAEENDEDA